MRRFIALLVAVALVLSLAPPSVGAVPDARLTVSDVTVAPDRPTTDEPTTVSTTVALSAGSTSAVELDDVTLQTDDGDRLARASNPGSLSPGDSLTVDLVGEFDEAGRQNLTVVARGTDADGDDVTIRRPVTVVVEDSPPGITVDADLVEGVTSPVVVELGNPGVDPVRNVEVSVLKNTAVADRAFVPTLAAGGEETLNLTVTPDGDRQEIAVRVSYTTATGDRQTTFRRETLRVDPLEDDVGIDVRPVREQQADVQAGGDLGSLLGGAGGGGSAGGNLQQDDAEGETPGQVEVAVTNFGNAPITEAVVEPAGEEPLARQFVGDLAPGETGTVTVDLSEASGGDIDVAVNYRLDREQRQTRTTYEYRPETAAITVTGVDMQQDGDRLVITGNAGNTGEASVSGVVVSVGETDSVTPAYPQRDYFVGTVDGSEFAPFELTARADDNATTVPVEVTYRVDGEAFTERYEFPVERSEDADNGGVFGSLWPFSLDIAGVGISVALGAAALVPLYRWRR
ncbi:hypothetical protein [Natronomonas gomsonensis]|uniref:hypothetical protein n=1 Tax=Natronomonas gomsonensis TaxID=1046043 RepID=UPI0015BB3B9E|nr:hypothetical protein [Natronomonas gomsonensis]